MRLGVTLPAPPGITTLDDVGTLEAEAATVAARLAEHSHEGLPFAALCQRFALDSRARDLLLIALAPSLDARFSRYYALADETLRRPEPTVDLCLSLWSHGLAEHLALRAAFAPTSPLFAHHLVSLDRRRMEHGESFLGLALRVHERVLGWVLGEHDLDASLRGFTNLVEPTGGLDTVVLPDGAESALRSLIDHHAELPAALEAAGLSERIPYGRGLVVLFVGPSGTGKTLAAKAVAHELGKRVLLVDPQQVYDSRRPVEDNLANVLREARLQDAVVFFDECEALLASRLAGGAHTATVLSAIEHYDGVVILATNLPQLLDEAVDRRVLVRVVFDAPNVAQRRRIWEAHLPPALRGELSLDRLSRDHELTGGAIKNAVLVALTRSLEGDARPPRLDHADLHDAARSQRRARLSEFAEKTPTPLRLEDLILPPDTDVQVREILAAARSRSVVFEDWGFAKKLSKGRGLSALFDGEPGTGKTLSAEIMAAELGLVLYRVNVANVVSKYIGETEKNLTRIFDEAGQAHCLLLFDEADALFGQRTDVKSVNDKYANMEINVLLQLVERYEGIVVLTTNLKKGIDKAFERRLSYKVYFPFPDAEYRERIWKQLLPDEAPVAKDVDFWVLGQSFELSGGSIKNALVRAAYRAAAAVRPIAMNDLVDAAKYECAAAGKLYRLVPSADDY